MTNQVGSTRCFFIYWWHITHFELDDDWGSEVSLFHQNQSFQNYNVHYWKLFRKSYFSKSPIIVSHIWQSHKEAKITECAFYSFLSTDQIDHSFIDFVIDTIENAPVDDNDNGEQLVDTFVPLILAFNQHFVGMEIVFIKNTPK